MIIVNLDPSFEPWGKGIEFEKITFPSGFELNIRFKEPKFNDDVMITTRIQTSDDIMLLLLATDAIKRGGAKNIRLFIPYFPYARQDRQMNPGESLSAKVIANLINQQNYHSVAVYDPHSDVTSALLDNCIVLNNHALVNTILKDKKDYLIVCPDAGAYKKVFDLCKTIKYTDSIVVCNKVRDLSSGKIIKTGVNFDNLNGKDCYIIDDICSKGGTFIAIAQELKLRNAGNIYLIVSHYEGSADEEKLKQHLNGVYSTNSMNDYQSDFIKQIKF